MSRGGGIARRIPEGFLTSQELADAVGVTKDTVTRWRRRGLLPAESTKTYGQVTVHLYTVKSVHLARALKDGLGTLEERAAEFHRDTAL